jgi:phosphatidylinositol phospholipase C epsilon
LPIGSNDDNSSGGLQVGGKQKSQRKVISSVDLTRLDSKEIIGSAPVRRRMFFLVIHGVVADEPSTILKITQESTASDVISQALAKANKSYENPNDYVLIEEVQRGWEKKRLVDRNNTTQRILDPNERPLEAQSQWKGDGKFVLKKLADDPTTRAWMTTIRTANKERIKRQDVMNLSTCDELNSEWNEDSENDTFLVCIYNVNEDQPYTIMRSSISANSLQIISQALAKARRPEDYGHFVIVEELEYYSDSNPNDSQSSSAYKTKSGKVGGIWRRVLDDNENVYSVQANWKTKGKFELKSRKDLTSNDMTQFNVTKLLRSRQSFKKFSHFHRSSSKKNIKKDIIPQTETPFNTKESIISCSSRDSYSSRDSSIRQTHSEGENDLPSDAEQDKKDHKTSITKLKKLSFRRLKVWK